MRRWLLVWAVYAGLAGFFLGASFLFGMYGRNVTESSIATHQKHEAAADETKSKKEETDEALAYYTLWLMAFTGVLAVATVGLGIATAMLYFTGEKQFRFAIRSSVRQSRDMRTSVSVADRAAQAAEDSLFVAQRPYIFVTAVNFKDPLASETLDYTGRAIWPWIYFHLENHGSTPASIIETCADSACVRELPLVPQYRENATYANPRLLGAGKDETVGYVFKTPIDGEVMMDVATPDFISPRGRHLFAFGYIKYKDIFEYTHTLGFCWRYHLGLKIFVPAEESGYTYRKAEPPKPT